MQLPNSNRYLLNVSKLPEQQPTQYYLFFISQIFTQKSSFTVQLRDLKTRQIQKYIIITYLQNVLIISLLHYAIAFQIKTPVPVDAVVIIQVTVAAGKPVLRREVLLWMARTVVELLVEVCKEVVLDEEVMVEGKVLMDAVVVVEEEVVVLLLVVACTEVVLVLELLEELEASKLAVGWVVVVEVVEALLLVVAYMEVELVVVLLMEVAAVNTELKGDLVVVVEEVAVALLKEVACMEEASAWELLVQLEVDMEVA